MSLSPGRHRGRSEHSGPAPKVSSPATASRSDRVSRPSSSAVSWVTAKPFLSSAGDGSSTVMPFSSNSGRSAPTDSSRSGVGSPPRNVRTVPTYSG